MFTSGERTWAHGHVDGKHEETRTGSRPAMGHNVCALLSPEESRGCRSQPDLHAGSSCKPDLQQRARSYVVKYSKAGRRLHQRRATIGVAADQARAEIPANSTLSSFWQLAPPTYACMHEPAMQHTMHEGWVEITAMAGETGELDLFLYLTVYWCSG